MKYLNTNEYGLNPMYAEYITEKIKGDELSRLNITLSTLAGDIAGKCDEYGELFVVKDTINIRVDNKYFGDLIINGTELYAAPVHDIKQEEFIQVSFRIYKEDLDTNRLLDKFLCDKLPHAFNVVGHAFYPFLIIHKDDLEKAHSIILNKLENKIIISMETMEREKIAYIRSIKDKYKRYM